MEIIIGREEGSQRLHCVANGRAFSIGQVGSVPLSVSRKHCKVTIIDGEITIENLNVQNITYVDGNQIFHKCITATSQVMLGSERFAIPLQQILQIATGASAGSQSAVHPVTAPTFSLKPLERV